MIQRVITSSLMQSIIDYIELRAKRSNGAVLELEAAK